MPRLFSRSRLETRQIAKKVISRFIKSKRRPIILALSGELGSGKTTFVQGLAGALCISSRVQSPTFVLMRWYALGKRFRPRRHFVHVDAYRLRRISEAKRIGLDKTFRDDKAIIAVEWAERIKKLIPKQAIWITFQHATKNQRIISVLD